MTEQFKHKLPLLLTVVFLSLFNISGSIAQNDSLNLTSDTIITDISYTTDTVAKRKHNPRLATLMSTVVPGAGQVYNKKYWKVPVIYVGFGVMIALYTENQKMFKVYKNKLADFDSTTTSVTIEGIPMNKETVELNKNKYRNARDLNVIIMVGIYLLNIVDASVDAHLFDYDVSDDLSIRVQPVIQKQHMVRNTVGIKLNMYF